MVSNHSIKWILILTLATSSCGLLTPAPTSPTPAPVELTAPAPTVVPSSPPLTVDSIRNAQYRVISLDAHPIVQLTDGNFQQGTDPVAPDYMVVTATDFIVLGDVNGDGLDEAAAIFVESFGGTGNFAVLAFFRNENGAPAFITSTLIDDRPMINGLGFEGHEIFVDAIVHGFEDAGCCPTLPSTRRYAVVTNQLRLTHLTTSNPAGDKREIVIDSPADGSAASGFVQVKGKISIAPFEKNLAYRIYDVAGKELNAGPIQVDAYDFGLPGTFDAPVDLTDIPSDTIVFIELQDVSAADGSMLAMDSVQLLVK
ncbi:MAG: hypothetical protein HZB19_06230 [Chloroflexi bacterium]|nr:hypothetical protein [Chloroflexota bacterium]